MTGEQKFLLAVMALTAFFVCVIAPIAVWQTIDISKIPTSVPPTATVPPTETVPLPTIAPTPLQHKSIGARVQCRQFVRDALLVPGSAKFSNEEAYGINGKPDNYHAVTGTVEAKNPFGVMIPGRFRCDVHYLPETPDVWVLDDLKLFQ